jgi:hypothetical protein
MYMGYTPRTYRRGRSYESRWNEPPFSPVFPDAFTWNWASREGDLLVMDAPLYGDREGHDGFIASAGEVLLYKDGEAFYQVPFDGSRLFIDLPPEPANYRLEFDVRQSMFELTTREKLVWTFESAHVPQDETQSLPLLTARFRPELDEHGRAARGGVCVPFEIGRFGAENRPHVEEPSVEVSYDDGETWQRARVERSGPEWNACLDHPRRADYVSLRAKVRDRDGNGLEQTLIRAYGLRRKR